MTDKTSFNDPPADSPEIAASSEFPAADIRTQRSFRTALADPSFWATWWLPLASVILASGLVWISFSARGPRIVVRFPDGHGLQRGNAVRYRGIDIGEVIDVHLGPQSETVNVVIRLEPRSAHLAREGTRFWIERPRVSLSRVSGLETVVGAKYVGVLPGPESGKTVESFDGLPNPPGLLEADSAEITIRFLQGYGLAVGDSLKHRGIVVGEVTRVDLNDSLTAVVVGVRLLESARTLARAGTQFWIERPKVSLASTRGLDTIVAGRYLAVLPGSSEAPPQIEFDGLETPPAAEERLEGGLEIILESPRRHGLEIGAPVTYRGLAVGYVVAVGLAADSSIIEARVYVQPTYKNLLRDNSQFWSLSGFDVDLGFTGLKLTAETLATIAAGGVGFATPAEPGKPVVTGHRYQLHEKANEEWLEWQPRMAISNAAAPHIASLPQPLRASLRWTEKKFGFSRHRQREGWVLPLNNGQLLGPTDLLTVPRLAVDQAATLELSGRELPLTGESRPFGDLTLRPVPADFAAKSPRWPHERLRVARQIEDGVLVPGWQEPSTVLAATHLKADEGKWSIAANIPIPSDLHGAAVIAAADGKLIGVVIAEKGQARVALLPEPAP